MGSCIVYPMVKINGTEVLSRLFKDLLSLTKDRELSKYIYGITKDDAFINNNPKLKLDSLGEVTFKSLKEVLNFNILLNPDRVLYYDKKYNLESIDDKDLNILYDNIDSILNRVLDFNKHNADYVASITRIGSKFQIDVEPKNINNLEYTDQLQFSSQLNNKLLGLIRKLGFDASIMDGNSRFKGMFDPLNALFTVNKLYLVIKIVDGLEGEEVFPEEVAHLVIEGLLREPLVLRVLNTLTPVVVKEILGDQYNTYSELYEGSTSKLQREAAGKLLAEQIKTKHSLMNSSLLQRLWNYVKLKFQKLSNNDIQNAIQEVRNNVSKIATKVLDNSIIPLISTEDIFKGETLYNIEEKVDKLKEIAEKALAIKSKELLIKTNKSKNNEYNPLDVDVIKTMLNEIYLSNNANSIITFLNNSVQLITSLKAELLNIQSTGLSNNNDINTIGRVSKALRNIKEFKDGYGLVIKDLTLASNMLLEGLIDISTEMAALIAELAVSLKRVLEDIEDTYNKLRFNVVYNFLKIYWGEDKILDIGLNKGKQLTLKFLLQMAEKDISFIDRFIKSMSDSSDPILATIDKAVKISQANRDNVLQSILNDIKISHNKLIEAGLSDQFMYERDSNGKLTGRLISDIDFNKFEAEKAAKLAELENNPNKLSFFTVRNKMLAWERKHTKKIIIDQESGSTEIIPDPNIYKIDVLSKLTPKQREYYDGMILAKLILESLLPAKYINTYRAVLIRNDALEAIVDNLNDPKEAARLLLSNLKDNFVRRADNDEYGLLEEGETNVKLDISGKPIELLPIYYTAPLEDTLRLSTDFTSSIMAYASMAVNYNEMSKIIDVLELTRDIVKDREVLLLSGNNKMVNTYKVLNHVFTEAFTKKADLTNIGARINEYYAALIYGKKKVDEGTIDLNFVELDIAETVDTIKSFTGSIGLGLNTFSAISNVLQGKILIFIESIGGEFYNMKNAATAEANYWALIGPHLSELNATNQHSKLGLMIDKFDALEEFFGKIKRLDFYKSAVNRILGSANIYFMNGMGEHYLHTKTMLAILDNTKVKDSKTGKIMSLFDAYEVKTTTSESGKILSGTLELKDGIVNIDDTPITLNQINNLKLKIGKINQMLNGAFNDMDKGSIHRYCLGRLAMQFRLWMPAHYQRRFGSTRYDPILDSWREGYYLTVGKFVINTLKELRQSKFQLAVNYHNLSLHEKANIKKAFTEISIFAILCILVSMIGSAKDRKGNWAMRMLIYQLNRLKLETGASTISPSLLDNIITITQTPAAAVKTIGNLADIFEVWNMFNEIESGRYKGYSVYEKNMIELIPVYGQIKKVFDLKDEDYMYKIFNQTK